MCKIPGGKFKKTKEISLQWFELLKDHPAIFAIVKRTAEGGGEGGTQIGIMAVAMRAFYICQRFYSHLTFYFFGGSNFEMLQLLFCRVR